MKKVEELKLWQLKNDKTGFEKVYNYVLREVEELPECKVKQHALADVLMRGRWWLGSTIHSLGMREITKSTDLDKIYLLCRRSCFHKPSLDKSRNLRLFHI